MNRTITRLVRTNFACARKLWPATISTLHRSSLRELTTSFGFSVLGGDLQLIDGRWYVTHSGLLRLAKRRHCAGIRTVAEKTLSDLSSDRWVFKAIVYKSPHSRGFVGYGDADPSTVSPLVRGAEMRVAETRAVNRALRKAYGIGLCSIEELGAFRAAAPGTAVGGARKTQSVPGNGSDQRQPRLRDRLCLLIRQHQLDPALVKRYAAEFCGTAALREASREQVESFINYLAEWAVKDREGLLCKLNGRAQTGGVNR
jgi:hypothetical protein